MKQIFGFEGPVRFTPVAAEFPKDVTYEDLEAVAKRVGAMRNATPFWIGDILVKAEAISDKYSQLSAVFDMNPDTLMNYKWVSSRVSISYRYEKLGWHYHYEVAKLEPKQQKYWLDLVTEKGWTLPQLKERLTAVGLRKTVINPVGVLNQPYREWIQRGIAAQKAVDQILDEIGKCETCAREGHLKFVVLKICPACDEELAARRSYGKTKGSL